MVEDGAFSHKIDYIVIFWEIRNLEGHQNCITGSRVTVILLNGWILPIGGASSGRVCSCSLCTVQQVCFLSRVLASKLDGVGPVDNRPSTD